MKSSVVEVQGTWLANAGARQLLGATARGLSQGNPQVTVALDPRWGTRAARAAAGVVSIAPRTFRGSGSVERVVGGIARVAPTTTARALAQRGYVERRNVAALVDSSGFALSDQWGARKARDRRRVVMAYAGRGRPVVLLPQAMGPFEDPATARAARDVLVAADAVWVRDRTSLAHAEALVGGRATVRLAPDVTLIQPAEQPGTPASAVVLVPNARVVSHGNWRRSEYVQALVDAAASARQVGRDVEVLLHTAERDDIALAEAVSGALGCRLVQESDAGRLKGYLGTAEIVVGSRFHALLGALSLGVPAIAIGWSHKYQELFNDFGVPELIAGSSPPSASALVRDISRDASDVRAQIKRNGDVLRRQVYAMWIAVWELLDWRVDASVDQVMESMRSNATRAHSAVSSSTKI